MTGGRPRKKIPLLRGSERGDFKTCQWMWWQAWREGLRGQTDKPNALWFGAGIHLALAHYYEPQGRSALKGFKRGPHPAETWQQYIKDETPRFFRKDGPGEVDEKEYGDLKELGEGMLTGYIEHYGEDSHWEFLAPELPFSVYIPDRFGNPLLNFVGTWDGAARDHSRNGEVIIVETKTAARISTRHLTHDPQNLGYDLVAEPALKEMGLIGKNEQVRYVVYNFLRKSVQKTDDRPVNAEGLRLNKDGTVSKRQKLQADLFGRFPIERTPAEKQSTVEALINEAAQMQAIRDGLFEPTKNPGFLGENCARCDFDLMCQLHDQKQDWEEFRDNFLIRRDPYADHRPGAVSSKFLEIVKEGNENI